MLTILRRRWPLARVIVRDVRVQGAGAARDIADGIEDLCRGQSLDVIIVGRGGGSLEDLWAFNEEIVARAIAASRLPVVSAVGHEVDFTIADFVADARAPTPTAAAALVVPDQAEGGRLYWRGPPTACGAARPAHAGRGGAPGAARAAPRRPRRRVADVRQRVDELGARSIVALRRRLAWERRELRIAPGASRERSGGARRRCASASAARAEHLRLGLAFRVRARPARVARREPARGAVAARLP
jgi:exodeoxyribonuclease VII large subunit